MFGHRFFGARYYGPRYFGDGGSVVVVVVPPAVVITTNPGGVGIRSGTRRTRAIYRRFRFKPEEVTATEIREVARELREDARDDPLSDEVEQTAAALERAVQSLANIERLSVSVAELSRAVAFALERREIAEREQAEDDEAAEMLLLA